MLNHRKRSLIVASVSLAVVWLLALGGFLYAKNSKMTAEKVRDFIRSKELARLSGQERAEALDELAKRINALPNEDRRVIRESREVWNWFEQMSEQEKARHLEATLPGGFKQMLAAFEDLPSDKRRRAISDAVKRLQDPTHTEEPRREGTPLSPELQQKIVTMGLKAYYGESSAQTKAELAPFLEELQRAMESGRLFHSRRQPPSQ